jgi:succinate dehydrogenase/fumarate reductase flavoprotein subunit
LDSESYDVIVIGAGAAGMTAATVSATMGLRVLLLEKTGLIGGTTAISGGMVWIPANTKARAVGREDSRADAETYLRSSIAKGLRPHLLGAFLDRAAEAIEYLEQHSALQFRPVKTYPDYFQNLPGATLGGRVLEPVPFNAAVLGDQFRLLRPPLPEFTLFGGMMVDRADIPHFRRAGVSLRSTLRVAGLLARHLRERIQHARGTTLVLGNALAARLLASLVQKNVKIRPDSSPQKLLQDSGRIAGVMCLRVGKLECLRARKGVVIATGGFSHNPGFRADLLPEAANEFSVAAPGATGDGLALGLEQGAVLREGADQNAFWTPVSVFHRRDGTKAVFPHTVTDRAKPGFIIVNQDGRRFANEAVSYHAFARAMMETKAPVGYLICDCHALRMYGLGALKPFASRRALNHFLRASDIIGAASIAGLAKALGMPAASLQSSVNDYNAGALRGVDEQFHRGEDAYQRHMGDADHGPNPCVAPLATPPFYAVALHPGDLATAAGLATNEKAQVLRRDGTVVAGLYACGADMSSVMEGSYPGPGITLGPALTFAYLAARDIAGQ